MWLGPGGWCVFHAWPGARVFGGPRGLEKECLEKKGFTRYSEDFGCGEAQRAGLSLLIANVGREREITGPSTDEQFCILLSGRAVS